MTVIPAYYGAAWVVRLKVYTETVNYTTARDNVWIVNMRTYSEKLRARPSEIRYDVRNRRKASVTQWTRTRAFAERADYATTLNGRWWDDKTLSVVMVSLTIAATMCGRLYYYYRSAREVIHLNRASSAIAKITVTLYSIQFGIIPETYTLIEHRSDVKHLRWQMAAALTIGCCCPR